MLEDIIDLLPSKALRAEIKKTRFCFSESQLLEIIDTYAPTFDKRIELLNRFSEIAPQRLKDIARTLIDGHREAFDKFCHDSEGFVYELHIKERPGAYDEKYLCCSYESALSYIDRFYEEYADIEAKETEKTVYRIVKRKVFVEGDTFCEDTFAECILGAGKTLLAVHDYRNPAKCESNCECSDCQEPCAHWFEELLFPCFAADKDIVKYLDNDGYEHFGVCLCGCGDRCNHICDALYVIPIDSEAMRYQIFDEIHSGHQHIDAPLAELVSVDELSEKDRNNYTAFVNWLEENN